VSHIILIRPQKRKHAFNKYYARFSLLLF
jgi:hypothetical protein